jgi:hypothetical protein
MSSYDKISRSLLRGSQEQDQYLVSLYNKYRQSSFCLEYSRLAVARREAICKFIAKHLVDEAIVEASTSELANLLYILDVLQRSVVYSLIANDFDKDNSIALQTLRDIYPTASVRVAATLPFSDLIRVVLKLLKDKLLPLVDEVKDSDGDPTVSTEVRKSLLAIFDCLQAFAADKDRDSESLNAEQSFNQAIPLPVESFFSMSYLLRAPEQSAVIIVLFVVTGLSLFSFKYSVAFGLVGVMLCSFLRVHAPANECRDISE